MNIFLAVVLVFQVSTLGVKTQYDRFKDTTTVRLTESLVPQRPGYVLFAVVGQIPGQDLQNTDPGAAQIVITSRTDEWFFLKTNTTLRAIFNEKDRVDIGVMRIANSEVVENGVLEQLTLQVSFNLLRKIGKAERVEMQIGRYEFELKPNQLTNLRLFISKFPAAK